MPRQFIGVVSAVNSSKIRREVLNGREHIVIGSYTLPNDVVMNGGLYPQAEIEKSYQSLEGTFAPIGHPTLNGQFVPAATPEAVHLFHGGAWNRNVKRDGNRVYLEKWVDVERAANTEKGRALLEAIDKGEPIHTSTGIFLEREPATNGEGYDWIARNMEFDHDAILLGEVGAATPEQGVGMMVNVAQASQLKTNAGQVLKNGGMRALEQALEQAARAKFNNGGDSYVWVPNFDDETMIVMHNDGTSQAYGYTRDGSGQITILDGGQSVKREENWVANILGRLGFTETARKLRENAVNSNPQTTNAPPEADEMDKKELDDALAKQGETLAANMAAALKPLVDGIAALAASQTATNELLTANARQQEAAKREVVAKKFGETVANSLSGAALDDMHARCVGKGNAPDDLTGNAGQGGGNDEELTLPE